jgi:hypothetical protein
VENELLGDCGFRDDEDNASEVETNPAVIKLEAILVRLE